MIVAEAVAALLKWATVATQLRSLRAMMERAFSASRTWALVRWRCGALRRAAATARWVRATQLERTLAFLQWRRRAAGIARARGLLSRVCARLCGLQLARGLTTLREACAVRRARRAWLFGLWRGATQKCAITHTDLTSPPSSLTLTSAPRIRRALTLT